MDWCRFLCSRVFRTRQKRYRVVGVFFVLFFLEFFLVFFLLISYTEISTIVIVNKRRLRPSGNLHWYMYMVHRTPYPLLVLFMLVAAKSSVDHTVYQKQKLHRLQYSFTCFTILTNQTFSRRSCLVVTISWRLS